jgi:hypothetical protein
MTVENLLEYFTSRMHFEERPASRMLGVESLSFKLEGREDTVGAIREQFAILDSFQRERHQNVTYVSDPYLFRNSRDRKNQNAS